MVYCLYCSTLQYRSNTSHNSDKKIVRKDRRVNPDNHYILLYVYSGILQYLYGNILQPHIITMILKSDHA